MRYSKLPSCLAIALLASTGFVASQPLSGSARPASHGTAIYEVHLKPDRTVSRVLVVQSSGSRRADEHGATELKKWRFAKAPASVRKARVPMTFTNRLLRRLGEASTRAAEDIANVSAGKK